MKIPIIDIVEEPKAEAYQKLIHLAATCCDRFYLVRRDQADFGPNARGIASALRPWLSHEERTDRWDGTRLLGHYATLSHYHLNPHSAKVLAGAADGLFAWQSPERPDDLTFYTSSGAVWMVSIAHEGVAYFDGRWVSARHLHQQVPGIVLKPSLSKGFSFLHRVPGKQTTG